MTRLLLAAATGLLLTACGSVPLGAAPSPNQTVTVTENDHSATLRVGQKLEVVLHARSGMAGWTRPESSDDSVLQPTVDTDATVAIGTTLARFIAAKPGIVQVTSNASPKCPPNSACPMYVALYTLVVTVTR